MVEGRRKRPQKALTRKAFRYKRDWKYYKENEQKHEFEEFEEDEVDQTEAGLLLLAGFFMTFVKFIALRESHVGGDPSAEIDIIINYVLGFLTVAGFNAIGEIMKGAESKRVQITSRVFKMISYIGFATLFYFIVTTN